MAAVTSQLIITDWSLEAINPDGTTNSWLPSISTGSVPPDPSAETIDWLGMGSEFKLVIEATISGQYSDGTNADLTGSLIRYNPALFLEYLGVFYPPGTFPQGGYTIQFASSGPSPSGSYTMVLVGQRDNLPCNQNGIVEIEYLSAGAFRITHNLYLTADVEQYPGGNFIPNYFRLSKNSVNAVDEGVIERPSVFGNQRGLNVNLVMKQRTFNTFAEDLSIPFKASFAGYDSSGNPESIEAEFIIELVSDPGVEQTSLSPFEANLIKVRFTDPSALIVEDESEVTATLRDLDYNVSTFEEDLQIKKAKLITSGGSAQLDGPIYEPITWSQAAGITEISFVLDNLEKSSLYQIHIRAAIQDNPSTQRFAHYMSEVETANGAPLEVPFTMESLFWSRNGNNGESFTISPLERCTSVVSMNASEYDAAVVDPWVTFLGDFDRITIEILDSDGEVEFTDTLIKGESNALTETEYIGVYESSGPSIDTVYYFYLKEFRVPGLNNQDLPNWIGETKTFRWTALFTDIRDSEYSAEYYQDTELTVTDYDNESVSPYVHNIRFLDPSTGYPISNWNELDSVLVSADVEAIGSSTYVQVMVDRFPLGTTLFNDYALEEEDPSSHSTPAYVIFEQKTSDLISELEAQPTEGSIAFLLDISELTDEEKYNIYITAYEG